MWCSEETSDVRMPPPPNQIEEERVQKRRFKNPLVNDVFGKGLHRKLVVTPIQNQVTSFPME